MTILTRIQLFILSFFLFSIHINCLTNAYAQDETQESISLLATPSLELPTFSVIEKSEIIQLETEKLEWKLKYTPVFPNSEDIVTNTGQRLVSVVDYKIDYSTGIVSFEESVLDQEVHTFRITYRAIPFTLLKTYRRELFGIPPEPVPEERQRKEMPLDRPGQTPTTPTTSTTTPLFTVRVFR